MASIKGLKKDINNVLGDLIDAVYIVEATNGSKVSKEGEQIIEKAITTFDDLIARVNDHKVESRKAQLTKVREDLQTTATALAEEVNKLA